MCVPLWCHPVWPSLLLWCFGCGTCCSPHHCASHTHHIWTVDVVEWHPHGFTQSTCHPLHQPLRLVVAIKSLANDGFHFKVVWQVTIAHRSNPSITLISAFQHLTSHRMAQWVSNGDVTLATHHITITSTCFPHQHCISGDGVCAWT